MTIYAENLDFAFYFNSNTARLRCQLKSKELGTKVHLRAHLRI